MLRHAIREANSSISNSDSVAAAADPPVVLKALDQGLL
jgi:hypothetical protein